MKTTVLFLSIGLLFLGCAKKSGGGDDSSESGDPSPSVFDPGNEGDPLAGEAGAGEVVTKYDENGLSVTEVTAAQAKAGFKVQAPGSNASLNGYVEFPPGALAISALSDVFIEQGAPMGEDVLNELGLETKPTSLAPAMIVQGGAGANIGGPFTLALGLPDGEMALLATDPAHIGILYRFYDPSTSILKTHVIASDKITVKDGLAIFTAPGFGVFQATHTSAALPKTIEPKKATTNQIRNASCTQVVDEDGIGKPIVSLAEVPVSYGVIKSCGYFVNAANQKKYNFGGRCSHPGAEITVTGAVKKTFACKSYHWGQTLDLSELPDGANSVTIKMSKDGKVLDEKLLTLKKNVVPPTVAISNYVQTSGERGNEWGADSVSPDIKYWKLKQVSGPGDFTYGAFDIDFAGSGFRISVGATVVGDYVMRLFFMDAEGNETVVEATCTITFTVNPDDVVLLAPVSFAADYRDQTGTVGFSYDARFYEGNDNYQVGVISYLVVRRVGAEVTWSPVDGTPYEPGGVDSDHVVVGSIGYYGSLEDSDVVAGQTYHYAIFEMGLGTRYSDPSHSSVTVTVPTVNQVGFLGGFPNKLWLDADKLYVGKGVRGFTIYDIAGAFSTQPSLLADHLTPATVNDLFVLGQHLYVAESDRLEIYDISAPSTPTLVATFQAADVADVHGFGSTVFLAAGNDLISLNVSDPSTPVELDRIAVEFYGLKYLISVEDLSGNDMVYGASNPLSGFSEIYSFNVETKTAMSQVQRLSAGSYNISDIDYGLESGAKRVYVSVTGSTNGIRKVVVDDPANMSFNGTYTPGNTATGSSGGVYVTDDNLNVVLVNTFTGLWTADMVPARTDAFDANTLDTAGGASDVVVNGTYAYIADKSAGIAIANLSDMAAPTAAGLVPTLEDPELMTLVTNFAFVSDRWNGMHILDLTSVTAPQFLGHYAVDSVSANHDNSGFVQDVIVIGNFAYLAAGAEGIVKLDISDKTNPVFSAVNRAGFSDARRIILAGTNLVVIDQINGLHILDQSLNSLGYSGAISAKSIAYDGTHLVAGLGTGGVAVYDISNPADFDTPVKSLALTGTDVSDVYAAGDTLYAADTANGDLLVLDRSSSMVLRQTVDAGGVAFTRLNVLGNHVYAVGSGNVYVFDAEDPTSVFLTGRLVLQSQYSHDIKFKDGKVLVTDSHMSDGSGLSVHDAF